MRLLGADVVPERGARDDELDRLRLEHLEVEDAVPADGAEATQLVHLRADDHVRLFVDGLGETATPEDVRVVHVRAVRARGGDARQSVLHPADALVLADLTL